MGIVTVKEKSHLLGKEILQSTQRLLFSYNRTVSADLHCKPCTYGQLSITPQYYHSPLKITSNTRPTAVFIGCDVYSCTLSANNNFTYVITGENPQLQEMTQSYKISRALGYLCQLRLCPFV